jgi:brefeldin A-inhibited guanine nucleotide-exchange protein
MEYYRKEIVQIEKKSQQLLSSADRKLSPFRSASQPELARPMFTTVAWPLMATLSLLFESSTDDENMDDDISLLINGGSLGPEPKVHELCLQGFMGGIRVSSIFRMETERDAFITSLSKLTSLSQIVSIRPKNVKAIKILLSLGIR